MRRSVLITTIVFVVLIALASVIYFKIRTPVLKKNFLCADCNVVLVSVDSLRADHIGAFGYDRDTTPNFDAFAQSGALFLNYFSTSVLTPVSEMSVHTGLYPTSHGVTNFDTVLPKNIKTLAEYLRGKDYRAAAILSSPEFEINPALKKSFSRGFDAYVYAGGDRASGMRAIPAPGTLNSELDAAGDKKFFLWLPVGRIHWPYGEGLKNIYADENYNGIFKNKKLDWNEFQNIYKNKHYGEKKELQDGDIQYVIDNYDNGVRAFDDFLGQLINELKRRNLLEKTIVVIESEHGEELNEHGYFAHYDVFDTQTHVPLFIFTPSFQKEQKISSFSGSVDVFPTIINLLGYVVPDWIQGKSLAPIMNGEEQDGIRQEMFMERNPLWEEAESAIRRILEERGVKVVSGEHKDIAIRTPEWKYILRLSQKRLEEISWWKSLTGQPANLQFIPEEELYNLTLDPMETRNVIDKYPKEGKMLRKKLENWFAEISSDAPLKVEREQKIQPYF